MPKRKCKFNEELQKKYPFMKRGRFDWEIVCTICSSTISIANKGSHDIIEHLGTNKHTKWDQNQAGISKIDNVFSKVPENDKVRAVEGTIAYHTIFHHMTFLSLDCTMNLNKILFQDSDIAKNATCNRTKATAIVKNVLSVLSTSKMMKEIEEVSFISVSCDTSNHGATKLLPILIQYYDVRNTGITTKLLEILKITDETSDTITDIILTELEKHVLSSKCVAFCGENCNTNFGGKNRIGQNNVFTKLKNKLQKQIIGVGCPAHIINNAVHKGCDNFSIDIESIVMKIFNHFSVFTVRTEALKEFCQQSEIEYSKLLYHSKTRWLSLYPAIERILKLFEPLKHYFLSLKDPPKVLKNFFENNFSEAFLFTLHSTMNIMHTNIEIIERADNSIIEVKKVLEEILYNLNQRISQKFMPLQIKEILRKLENTGKSTTEFIKEVHEFYLTMKNYLESWIVPLKELDIFEWMDVSKVKSLQWSDLEPSLEFLRFRNIMVDEEKLFNEFLCFQKFVKNIPDETTTNCNKLWCNFFKKYEDGKNCHELRKIAQFFFCLPAHNANVERIFSLIHAQWSTERNKLQLQTISDIIKIKCNFQMTCEEFYQYLLKCDKKVLKDIGSSEKYIDKTT